MHCKGRPQMRAALLRPPEIPLVCEFQRRNKSGADIMKLVKFIAAGLACGNNGLGFPRTIRRGKTLCTMP